MISSRPVLSRLPPLKTISARARRKARWIKLLLLDVDGVLTDGGITIDDRGGEIKRFDVRDGHGIKLLQAGGIEVALITGRFSKVVFHRARDLGIRRVYQKAQNKFFTYKKMKAQTGYEDGQIAYIGDDLVDLPLLGRVGLSITVEDSCKELKSRVDYVTAHKGGHGAVREVAEFLLRAQRRWDELLSEYLA
jgi:3-deoxy-D-manno-octulosonate 8-phosphate phosphatase (KDO 8-P phosphatase)